MKIAFINFNLRSRSLAHCINVSGAKLLVVGQGKYINEPRHWGICGHRKPRSHCAFEQSYQGFRSLHTKSLDTVAYINNIEQESLSNCTYSLVEL